MEDRNLAFALLIDLIAAEKLYQGGVIEAAAKRYHKARERLKQAAFGSVHEEQNPFSGAETANTGQKERGRDR